MVLGKPGLLQSVVASIVVSLIMTQGLSDVRVDYLEHAKEGVRIIELAISEIKKAGGEPGAITQRLLKNCTNVLLKAERDYANGSAEMIAQKRREEAEADEEDEEEDGQGSDEDEKKMRKETRTRERTSRRR